jgi:glycerol dehydrogenase
MVKNFISPSRYVQGPDALSKCGEYIAKVGKKALILGGKTALSETLETVKRSLTENNVEIVATEIFSGECTAKKINQYGEEAKKKGAEIVIGIGGGKAIDSAKGAAFKSNCSAVVIPTIASTDAPTSSFSVVYTEEGAVEDLWTYPTNPFMVLVDTEVIARSPVRTLVSGMGDALSTYYEARTCRENGKAWTIAGERPTDLAFAIATLCRDTLFEYGMEAKKSIEAKVVTPALEKVVEANVLLSGLGFESGGLSAAHGTVEGLTVLHHSPKYNISTLHGEEVAFGTIVLLVIEGRPFKEIEEVIKFCKLVGLPTTFEELGIGNITDEDLWKAAEYATTRAILQNLNMEVTASIVYNGMKAANQISQEYKNCFSR